MQVKLKDVRIAFTNSLLGPAEDYQGNGKFRHSATFLIEPKSESDKAILAAIEQEGKNVYQKKSEAILAGLRGNANKFCYQSGDLKDYDGFEGVMTITGHRRKEDGRPLLLDSIADPETGKPAKLLGSDGKFKEGKEGRIYAGCYVNAVIEIYCQSGQNAGVRCGLMAVQYLRGGDSFSAAKKGSEDDFEAIEEGADAMDIE